MRTPPATGADPLARADPGAPVHPLARAYARVLAAEARIAIAMLVTMVVLILVAALSRLIGHPLNWAVDAATCLFAWACFLAADVAWRRDGLMAIDLLPARLPPAWQRRLAAVNLLLISAFLVYVIIAGTWLAWVSRARSFQGIPEISYSWVTASMPAGAVLLLVTALLKLRAVLRPAVFLNRPSS